MSDDTRQSATEKLVTDIQRAANCERLYVCRMTLNRALRTYGQDAIRETIDIVALETRITALRRAMLQVSTSRVHMASGLRAALEKALKLDNVAAGLDDRGKDGTTAAIVNLGESLSAALVDFEDEDDAE